MRRVACEPREGWRDKLAALGLDMAPATSPYWNEEAAYVFDESEVETLHAATVEIERLVLEAVGHVIDTGRCAELGIGPALADLAARSWNADERSLYGRYDLRYDGGGPPKLIEYNADTPTALFEASVVQWHWLRDTHPDADQFNSIHEGLIEAWRERRAAGLGPLVHFACVPEDDDDLITTAYLLDTALQAGLETRLLAVDEIGWDGRHFVDLDLAAITALFKLYPWDWLAEERFFPRLASAAPSRITVIEPAWRVVASSKGLLAILWEMFPGHPNLLPAALGSAHIDGSVIVKPMLGREGANMVIRDGTTTTATDGPYADGPRLTQAFVPLPDFDGWHPVLGVWTIDGEPRGLAVREDRHLVTGRGARLLPHMMLPRR